MQRKVVLALKYAALVLYSAISLFPLVWMASASVKPPGEVLRIPVEWIGSYFRWENFSEALFEPRFSGYNLLHYIGNSVLVAVTTAVLSITLSLFVGYGFAKFRFRGRSGLMWTMLATTLLPFSSILVPMIVITRALGLQDTLLALIVPFALTGQGIFLARQFMLQVPRDLIEAARVEGAGELRIFISIVLPLMGPAVATLGVTAFVMSWTQFLWPLVSQSSQGNFTVPVGLSLMGLGSTFLVDYHIWMAAAALSILPPLAFFLIMERPYLRGLEALSGLRE
jgi:multiple sugar transport system permease protein